MGFEVGGQHLEPTRAVLACRVLEPDRWCRCCGCEGTPRHPVLRAPGARAAGSAPHDAKTPARLARVADNLSVSWHTANAAVLDEGRRVLINDPRRFDGVAEQEPTSTQLDSTGESEQVAARLDPGCGLGHPTRTRFWRLVREVVGAGPGVERKRRAARSANPVHVS
jgi:hypothetical protein